MAASVKSEDEIDLLKTQLYAACEEECASHPDKPFSQEDLMALDVIPDNQIKKLLAAINGLVAEKLFTPVTYMGNLAWKLRSREDAAKYKLIKSHDQTLVYEIIDNAGPEGAWQQDIKRRLNLQDNALRKALKELEAKRLVQQFTTVENTSKKMWIKSSLTPSARATGGPWYTDQFLDEAFIESLQSVVMDIIKGRGSYRSTRERTGSTSPVLPKKGVINGAASEAALKSRKRSAGDAGIHDAAPPPKASRGGNRTTTVVRLPLPAGYTGYPTTEEITTQLIEAGIAKGQQLKSEHVQELIDVLVWENRVESIRQGTRVAWRATRVTRHNPAGHTAMNADDFWEPRSNGLTTVPCGKCPVFELCEEGGPVWAGGCEYFDKWLA
ncbi:RNA polymerase Rpc34 subunit [Xylariomycetidae sp. FL2044]|nr:RNA polymerase Rpc34 subunit [Xylariomycetidae sp. FL2044]